MALPRPIMKSHFLERRLLGQSVATFFRVTGWVATCAIGGLSLVPGSARPHILGTGQFEHLTAYAMTALAFCLGYLDRTARLRIGLGLSCLAATLEIAQLWVPGRVSQFSDFAAGSIGAWIIVCIVEGFFILRRS